VIDPDEDVSPDSADPEAVGEAGKAALENENNDAVSSTKVSTRQWAHDVNYDAKKLFRKFFHDDIQYLLSMENLWANRRKPTPLDWETLSDEGLCNTFKKISGAVLTMFAKHWNNFP